jgi:DNA-directed RNA polymerase subunit omega
MARVTVEDRLAVIPNPFELTVAAAQRARDIGAGAALTIARDNDKNSVIALREIAQQTGGGGRPERSPGSQPAKIWPTRCGHR